MVSDQLAHRHWRRCSGTQAQRLTAVTGSGTLTRSQAASIVVGPGWPGAKLDLTGIGRTPTSGPDSAPFRDW